MSDLALPAARPVTHGIGSTPQIVAASPDRASLTVWISIFAAMIGAFMAILNIQITNASLLKSRAGSAPASTTAPGSRRPI